MLHQYVCEYHRTATAHVDHATNAVKAAVAKEQWHEKVEQGQKEEHEQDRWKLKQSELFSTLVTDLMIARQNSEAQAQQAADKATGSEATAGWADNLITEAMAQHAAEQAAREGGAAAAARDRGSIREEDRPNFVRSADSTAALAEVPSSRSPPSQRRNRLRTPRRTRQMRRRSAASACVTEPKADSRASRFTQLCLPTPPHLN